MAGKNCSVYLEIKKKNQYIVKYIKKNKNLFVYTRILEIGL